MNRSRLNWITHQTEWITIELNSTLPRRMAHKLNGILPKRMDHVKLNGSQIEWHTSKLNGSQLDGPPRIEFWTMLKEHGIDWSPLGFSRASRSMAARTPCNAGGEDENGGGDPQQILESFAQSLLTAVARLKGGKTPVARSSSPSTSSTIIDEHRRLFGYQTPSSSRCGRGSDTQSGQGPRKRVIK